MRCGDVGSLGNGRGFSFTSSGFFPLYTFHWFPSKLTAGPNAPCTACICTSNCEPKHIGPPHPGSSRLSGLGWAGYSTTTVGSAPVLTTRHALGSAVLAPMASISSAPCINQAFGVRKPRCLALWAEGRGFGRLASATTHYMRFCFLTELRQPFWRLQV